MGNLKPVLDALDNGPATVQDWDAYDAWVANLDKVVQYDQDLDKMNKREIFAHIRALKTANSTLRTYNHERIQMAKGIIKGWMILDEACKNDQELADDWLAFQTTMRLKGMSEKDKN